MSITIRPCHKNDEADIVNVCYRTGFMGEDLTGSGRFNDVKLFGYLFCLYYPRYEPQNCFVAEDDSSHRVIGYILGTSNTSKQRIAFVLRMGGRIAFRLLFCTIWRYPESFAAVMHIVRNADLRTETKDFDQTFPAHLHINILPDYQRFGLGKRLLSAFETEMTARAVSSIHLRTSNKNYKAFPFYLKNDYVIIHRGKGSVWAGVPDYQHIIFGKKLQ